MSSAAGPDYQGDVDSKLDMLISRIQSLGGNEKASAEPMPKQQPRPAGSVGPTTADRQQALPKHPRSPRHRPHHQHLPPATPPAAATQPAPAVAPPAPAGPAAPATIPTSAAPPPRSSSQAPNPNIHTGQTNAGPLCTRIHAQSRRTMATRRTRRHEFCRRQ